MFDFFKKRENILFVGKPENKNSVYTSKEFSTREKVDFNTIFGYLPDPDEILLETGKTYEVYRKIMVDSQIRACTNSRKAGVRSLLWDIDRGEETESKEAKIIREFYEQDLDIDGVNDAILNAPLMGFQPIEIIWGRIGKYILPLELKPKNQEWFIFNDKSELHLRTKYSFLTGEKMPPRKFLLPTYTDINNKFYNPYGDRVLSSCFWPATFKKSGFKWWATFTEKYGMPYLIGKVPANQNQGRTELLQELKNMALDAVAVVSSDSEVTMQQTGGTSSADLYDKLITSCDAAIAKAILGQTLTTEGSDGGVGSQALGTVHSGIRDDIIAGDQKLVEHTHNQLIQWIMDVNFGTVARSPKYEMYEEEDVDLNVAQRDRILKDTGVKFTKTYFIKTYDLEEDDFDVTETPEPGQFPGNDKPLPPLGTPSKELRDVLDTVEITNKEDFAEKGLTYIDELIISFTDKQLQEQIKGALQPLFKAINDVKTYEAVKAQLNNIKPDMQTQDLEEQLTKAIFIAQLLGSKDAREGA